MKCLLRILVAGAALLAMPRRSQRQRASLSEQADHHHRPVRARQRHRHHHPRRRRSRSASRSSRASWSRPGRARTARIAALYVARAAPDGYTLFMSTNTPHSAAPFLMKNVAYDPVKDFTRDHADGQLHADAGDASRAFRRRSVKELIAYAKANPGKLSFASGNTSGVVAGETLKHWAELDMLHVPYKSAPPALHDLLAGRVSMMFTDFTTGLPHVRAGSAARAGGDAASSAARCSRAADHGRGRRHRLRHGFLGRHLRARQHAAGDRRRCSTPSCARSSTAPRSRRSSATPASRRSRARRRSWTTSSRSSSASGARWSRTPASSRNEAAAVDRPLVGFERSAT